MAIMQKSLTLKGMRFILRGLLIAVILTMRKCVSTGMNLRKEYYQEKIRIRWYNNSQKYKRSKISSVEGRFKLSQDIPK